MKACLHCQRLSLEAATYCVECGRSKFACIMMQSEQDDVREDRAGNQAEDRRDPGGSEG